MDDALRSLDCRCEALRESSAYFRLGLRDGDAAIEPALVDAAAIERLRGKLREAAGGGGRAREQLLTAPAGALLGTDPAVVGFAVTRDSAGPHTAYGFFAPARALSDLFERWHRTGELLPPAIGGGMPNDSLLHIAVRDPTGATLFESAVSFPPSFPVQDTIGARYASLVVEVWTRPDAASIRFARIVSAPSNVAWPVMTACPFDTCAVSGARSTRSPAIQALRSPAPNGTLSPAFV